MIIIYNSIPLMGRICILAHYNLSIYPNTGK